MIIKEILKEILMVIKEILKSALYINFNNNLYKISLCKLKRLKRVICNTMKMKRTEIFPFILLFVTGKAAGFSF